MDSIREGLLESLRKVPNKRLPTEAKTNPAAYKLAAEAEIRGNPASIVGLPVPLEYVPEGDYYSAPNTVLILVIASALIGGSKTLILRLIEAATVRGFIPGLRLGFILYIQRTAVIYDTTPNQITAITRDVDLTLNDFETLYSYRDRIGKTLSPLALARWSESAQPTQPVQVFFGDDSGLISTNSKTRTERIAAIKAVLAKKPHPLFIHAPLNSNLAISDTNIRWHALDVKDGVALGARGIIVHPGSATVPLPAPVVMGTLRANIRKLLKPATPLCPLLIENMAREGSDICWSPEELIELYRSFTPDEQLRFGFCVDTQHAYSAGFDVMTFLETIEAAVPGKIRLVHYNDSLRERGCLCDRHSPVGGSGFGDIGAVVQSRIVPKCDVVGSLGHIGIRKMGQVAEWCSTRQIPMVAEW